MYTYIYIYCICKYASKYFLKHVFGPIGNQRMKWEKKKHKGKQRWEIQLTLVQVVWVNMWNKIRTAFALYIIQKAIKVCASQCLKPYLNLLPEKIDGPAPVSAQPQAHRNRDLEVQESSAHLIRIVRQENAERRLPGIFLNGKPPQGHDWQASPYNVGPQL